MAMAKLIAFMIVFAQLTIFVWFSARLMEANLDANFTMVVFMFMLMLVVAGVVVTLGAQPYYEARKKKRVRKPGY